MIYTSSVPNLALQKVIIKCNKHDTLVKGRSEERRRRAFYRGFWFPLLEVFGVLNIEAWKLFPLIEFFAYRLRFNSGMTIFMPDTKTHYCLLIWIGNCLKTVHVIINIFFFCIGVSTVYAITAELVLAHHSFLLCAVWRQLDIRKKTRSLSNWSFQRSGGLFHPLTKPV